MEREQFFKVKSFQLVLHGVRLGHLRLTTEVLTAFVSVLIFRFTRQSWIIIDNTQWTSAPWQAFS